MEKLPSTVLKPDLLRKLGNDTLALLERHFQRLNSARVCPADLKPGDLAAKFSKAPPERPQEFGQLLQEVEEKVLPGVTNWQHKNFFAYYPANTSVPAVLADTIVTAVGAVGLQWQSNPIATELEVVVMEWLSQMFGITGDFLHSSGKGGGLIQSTASDAIASVTVCARVAKHRQLGAQGDEAYYRDSSRFVRYQSSDSHFSGKKAARLAGVRTRELTPKLLAETGNYGITAEQVEEAMKEDIAKGLVPFMVQLNHGSTNTCGYDLLEGFAELREKYGVWVHADCAYAGSSWILPERHHHSKAIQNACDSFNINGSKALLCGFDSALLWVRERKRLLDVYSATDVFMAQADTFNVYNPELKDWAPPLGRRFRSLRIWMVISYFGVEGMRNYVRRYIRQADLLRRHVEEVEGFEGTVTTDLGLVCFKVMASDGSNISDAVCQRIGEANILAYPSALQDGTRFIRIAIGSVNTTDEDVNDMWSCIKAARDSISQEKSSPGHDACEREE